MKTARQSYQPSRAGFTLVELMVAAALVVLIMFLFAQIFQIATGTMVEMKGLAENDQRARTLTTIIRNDLKRRTFQNLVPWLPNEGVGDDDPDAPPSQRVGYFYISENDPDNDSDDVLQFTMQADSDEDPFYGRAGWSLSAADVGANRKSYLDDGDNEPDLNQPDFSNGILGDQAGTSPNAEVCYFLRNGILYRRILLIRDEDTNDADPKNAPESGTSTPGPSDFFDNPGETFSYINTLANLSPSQNPAFLRDFDFSAFYNPGSAARMEFHSTDDLSNEPLRGFFPFGKPTTRFGFDPYTGQPQEFLPNASGASVFLGRFTHEETSDNGFLFPFQVPSTGENNAMSNSSPFTMQNGVATWPSSEGYTNISRTRRAEDILMTNVFAFDIKVLDERYQETDTKSPPTGLVNPNNNADIANDANRNGILENAGVGLSNRVPVFADIGHGAADGWFARTVSSEAHLGNQRTGYGDNGSNNNIFDTWHPEYNYSDPLLMDSTDSIVTWSPFNGTGSEDIPPFPLRHDDNPPTKVPAIDPGDPEPLKAIQIKILLHDISSDQLRELTIVQSLTPKGGVLDSFNSDN